MTISCAKFIGAALAGIVCAVTLAPVQDAAGETIRSGGTGSGLAMMKAIGEGYSAANPDTTIEVLPSLHSSGGIKAVVAKAIDIALIANRLSPEHAAQGLQEGACLRTGLIFATSHSIPMGITLARLPELMADPNSTWPNGQALKIILRGRLSSETSFLIKSLPAMKDAFEKAYARSGVPIGATDQENVDLAQRTAGSFAIMTLLQLRAENLPLQPLSLEGVTPSRATLAAGTYALPWDICLVVTTQPSAAALRVVDYVRSREGQKILRGFDALPLNEAPPRVAG